MCDSKALMACYLNTSGQSDIIIIHNTIKCNCIVCVNKVLLKDIQLHV